MNPRGPDLAPLPTKLQDPAGAPDRRFELPPGGVGHAGPGHFYFDAGEGFLVEFFLSLLRSHLAMMPSTQKEYRSILTREATKLYFCQITLDSATQSFWGPCRTAPYVRMLTLAGIGASEQEGRLKALSHTSS